MFVSIDNKAKQITELTKANMFQHKGGRPTYLDVESVGPSMGALRPCLLFNTDGVE